MLYMIELHYERDRRDEILQHFWEHGATHHEGGIVVKGAWVATHDQIGYALVESKDAAGVEAACAPLASFGEVKHHAVISADQI